MLSAHFLSTLFLAAAAWMGADLYRRAASDTPRPDLVMTAELTTRRPAIDLEAPAEFQTATFALG